MVRRLIINVNLYFKIFLDEKFKNVAFCGVFAEYCVNQAAIGAKKKGFNVSVIRDLIGYSLLISLEGKRRPDPFHEMGYRQ